MRGAGRAHGHRRRGGPDGRRGPHRAFLERPVPPGLSAGDRSPRCGSRAGWWGSAPVRPVPRLDAQERPAGGDRAARRLGRGAQRPGRRHGNEGAAFAREHGAAGRRRVRRPAMLEVGVAYTALDGDPSTPDGLLAALPSVEFVPGRATYYRAPLDAGREGRQPRLRGNGRLRPLRHGTDRRYERARGQDHRPMDAARGDP